MKLLFASILALVVVAAAAAESASTKKHWAFVPPIRPVWPAVKQTHWPRNEIDYFILARLEREGIKPASEADRVTLIRRLSLDLTGLPPTIDEVDQFVKDRRPDAYERVVERLLASPHYGERWGRHWLDVARYSDSNGYSIDAPRSVWKYRDWVINAFNRDLPFDQFVIEQLGGDLLPNATLDQKIATGFHRNTQINQEGGIDPEQFRIECVMDRVATTGTAFLGLTIGCAQCHDHKFDPISQREYYQLFAFFNSTVEDGHGKSMPGGLLEVPGEFEPGENIEKELQEAEADLDRYLDTKGSAVSQWEQSLAPEQIAKLKTEVRDVLKVPFAELTKKQKRTVYSAFRPDDSEFKSRNNQLTKLEKKQPKPITTLVMSELKAPRPTFRLIKGDFTRPAEPVTPGVPAILHPFNPSVTSLDGGIVEPLNRPADAAIQPFKDSTNAPTTPTRLDLARWLVNPANPLLARVTVNRIWQQYFGRGLVETENDFGLQGSPPTHPDLLDWLATEFASRTGVPPVPPGRLAREQSENQPQNHGRDARPDRRDAYPTTTPAPPWSIKHIHRLIVTSATYRQSSRARPELATIDPGNKLLARQSRLRLDAEIVRDVCLTASGLLSDKIGGPSVFPPQPDGVMNLGQSRREWKPSPGPDRYRRAMYTFFWRATPHPALTVFDSPDAFSTCTRRLRSNTPLQALTLLNEQAFYECAQALARRVISEKPGSDADRLDYAFRLCLCRKPSAKERQRLRQVLGEEVSQEPETTNAKQLAAWTTIARVLLNLDESITRE